MRSAVRGLVFTRSQVRRLATEKGDAPVGMWGEEGGNVQKRNNELRKF